MEHQHERLEQTPFDAGVGATLDRMSQRVSRRSALAKLGKLVLATVGVSVVTEVLPVSHGVADADIACSDWRMCNFCGNQCDCCNGTAGIGTCPSCATIGTYWTGCCCAPDGFSKTVRYWDCMKGSCSTTKYDQCKGCLSCSRGCPQPVWGDGNYMCTAVIVTSETCGVCIPT